jgi:hypothetical protein
MATVRQIANSLVYASTQCKATDDDSFPSIQMMNKFLNFQNSKSITINQTDL